MKRKFISAGADVPKPERLYHATSHEITGGLIEPRPGFTHERRRYGNFVFATDELALAAAHAMKSPYARTTGFMDASVYCLIADLDEYLKNEPSGHIYAFTSDLFTSGEPIHDPHYEWIREEPLNMADVLETIEIKGMKDAMQKGVQVFSMNMHELPNTDMDLAHGKISYHRAATMIYNKTISWQNVIYNIRPCQKLSNELQERYPEFSAAAPG